MIPSLNIVDDFFPAAQVQGIREFALSHDFTQAPEHDGHQYPGFAPVKDPRFTQFLEVLMEGVMHLPVRISMAAFVAGKEGFSTVQWIHSDNGCSGLAAVVYLFDKSGHGTMFWKHKATGAEGLKPYLQSLHSPNPVADLYADGKSDAAWSTTDYCESKFNRLVFYPTDRFHSRWPEKAFGSTPEDCRLTLVFFFDIAPEQ